MSVLGCPYCGLDFGHTLLCPVTVKSDVARERGFLNSPTTPDLYAAERERAEREHSPEKWSKYVHNDMVDVFEDEMAEFWSAILRNDFDGPHGAKIEAIHCRIVMDRIIEECQRREGR